MTWYEIHEVLLAPFFQQSPLTDPEQRWQYGYSVGAHASGYYRQRRTRR